MSRGKAILGVVLVFIVGILMGISLTVKLVERRVNSLVDGGPQVLTDVIMRRLDHRLDLTVAQRDKVYEVATRTRADLYTLRAGLQPQVDALMEASVQDIRAVLTKDQAVVFDKLLEKGRERWGRFGKEGLGHP
jgi:hypothetical protein